MISGHFKGLISIFKECGDVFTCKSCMMVERTDESASCSHIDAVIFRQGKNIKGQTVFITHGDCFEDAKFIAAAIKTKYGVGEVVINCLDPVIASHAGPGTLAIFFVGNER